MRQINSKVKGICVESDWKGNIMSEEKFLVIDNADHTAWLKARGYGIGGSDASANSWNESL